MLGPQFYVCGVRKKHVLWEVRGLKASAVLVWTVYAPDEKTARKAALKELTVRPVDQNSPSDTTDSITGSEQSPDYTEPKNAWKTDLLAVFLIFAFATVAMLTFIR
jgi:hypothetical protein